MVNWTMVGWTMAYLAREDDSACLIRVHATGGVVGILQAFQAHHAGTGNVCRRCTAGRQIGQGRMGVPAAWRLQSPTEQCWWHHEDARAGSTPVTLK